MNEIATMGHPLAESSVSENLEAWASIKLLLMQKALNP
ncbi:hypothetical protein VCSRO85_1848 [Vibrio cholerae]|nr:hypothetical protein VCSRO85_1848 [Vibrio cholerae]